MAIFTAGMYGFYVTVMDGLETRFQVGHFPPETISTDLTELVPIGLCNLSYPDSTFTNWLKSPNLMLSTRHLVNNIRVKYLTFV